MTEWIVHHQTNKRIDLSSRLNKFTHPHLPVFSLWSLWHARHRSTPAKFINIYHGIICGTQRQSTHCTVFPLSLSYCHNTPEACLGFIHLFSYLAFPLACPDPCSSNKQIECKISNRIQPGNQKMNEGKIKSKLVVSICIHFNIYALNMAWNYVL